MKTFLILLFLFTTSLFFSQSAKDSFSIVFTSRNEFVNIYKSYSENSEIITKIPAGAIDIKTTWKTYFFNEEFWVEILYGEKKGFIKRKFITRGFDELTAKNAVQIDKILQKMTTSLQQKDAFTFKDMIYSLRGIAMYDSADGQMFRYDRKELNPMFANLSDTGTFEADFFNKVLRILETDFFIQYNNGEIRKDLPVDLVNFQFVSITNDYDDLELCVGFESWNSVIYVSFLALLYK
jgi:hypothetical protein